MAHPPIADLKGLHPLIELGHPLIKLGQVLVDWSEDPHHCSIKPGRLASWTPRHIYSAKNKYKPKDVPSPDANNAV
jgi:hypothetical protein